MREKKVRRKIFLTLATVCLLLSGVVCFEVFSVSSSVNDFYSSDLLTLSMFEYAKYSLQQGDIFNGIEYLYLASVRAIEFPKYQQKAKPLIEEYHRLYQQGDYKNALIVCEKARSILGRYDDRNTIAYGCSRTKEQLEMQSESP